MGSVPSWYRLIKAAQYLGVAPWDLAGREAAWTHMAEAAQAAEAHAEAMRRKHSQRPQGA